MIRTRLLLGNAVIFALALTLIGAVVFLTTRSGLYRAVDDDLNTRAAFLEHMSRGGPFDHDGPGGPDGRGGPDGPPPDERGRPSHGPRLNRTAEFLSGARGLDPIEAARVEFTAHLAMPRRFSLDGRPEGPGDDGAFDPDALRRSLTGWRGFTLESIDGHHLRVLSLPIWRSGKISGAAQFATNLDDVDTSVARLGTILLAMLPLALVGTSLVGVWLTRRALRPVREIAEAAERIEATNMSSRLPVQGSDDFAFLSGRFNSMLDRIGTSFTRLEAAYDAQRRFISDASHELKTPLTTVKGRVGVALAGAQTPERYAEHMIAIGRAADSMTSIISDLLLLARSDEDKLVLRRESVRVSKLAAEAAVAASPLNPERVDIDIAEDDELKVDAALFVRALTNLIGNAVRHCPPPGRVILRARREGDRVQIQVEDEGQGIPAEHLPHLFERFHRVDPSRERGSGGTGLGLSIVKSIVEAHGGTVSIVSTFGTGTIVTVELPK